MEDGKPLVVLGLRNKNMRSSKHFKFCFDPNNPQDDTDTYLGICRKTGYVCSGFTFFIMILLVTTEFWWLASRAPSLRDTVKTYTNLLSSSSGDYVRNYQENHRLFLYFDLLRTPNEGSECGFRANGSMHLFWNLFRPPFTSKSSCYVGGSIRSEIRGSSLILP